MPYLNSEKKREYARNYMKKKYWEDVEASRKKERKRIRKRDNKYTERQKEYHREYYKRPENKEKILISRYANRFFKDELLEKYNNKCLDCENHNNLVIHHLSYKTLPRPRGGGVYLVKHDINQCIIVCTGCHGKRHRRYHD